jgi:hypothetical protein
MKMPGRFSQAAPFINAFREGGGKEENQFPQSDREKSF